MIDTNLIINKEKQGLFYRIQVFFYNQEFETFGLNEEVCAFEICSMLNYKFGYNQTKKLLPNLYDDILNSKLK